MLLSYLYVGGLLFATAFVVRDHAWLTPASNAVFDAIYRPVVYDLAPDVVRQAWWQWALRMCALSSDCEVLGPGAIYVHRQPAL
jgi:hypothetical protein